MVIQVRPIQLQQWLEQAGTLAVPLVLDVREPHELQMASVRAEGFELKAIPMGVIPVRLHELDRNRPVACLCHHGGRSMQVAQYLARQGFAHVANIAGGIHAWSDEVDATVPRY